VTQRFFSVSLCLCVKHCYTILEMKSILVLISANAEWKAVREFYPEAIYQSGPYGEWFTRSLVARPTGQVKQAVFLHGGWGKIAAAASAEYAIQCFQPELIVNLGTCGGFSGRVERGEILLATETVVYDIIEQMGDAQQALDHYTTHLDLDWLPATLPLPVRRARLVSADRDILPQDITMLRERFDAVACDWESGAIAWVAARHDLRCLILRGVSDLVDEGGGEAYGKLDLFHEQAALILSRLLESLPLWVE